MNTRSRIDLSFFVRNCLRGFFFALFASCGDSEAQIGLTIETLPDTRVRVHWVEGGGTFQLEKTGALGQAWQASGLVPQVSGTQRTVDVPVTDAAQFFRLRQLTAATLTIEATSPSQGETGVAVTRETIIRLNAALADGTAINTNTLQAVAGGRRILSRVELGQDRRKATLFYLEPLPGDAHVDVSFDGTGLFDEFNRPVDLDGDGIPGGTAHLLFDTLSTTSVSTTAIHGRVFAAERNPDGSNRPLRNVTITVDGKEESLRATTDANGYFNLQPCPAGRFFVAVDGRTADGSEWPGGAYYPFVGKAWEAAPGRTNNLAGGSGVIYLPHIQAETLKPVSMTAATRITFAPSVLATNPALAGVEIMVPANSLYSDSGVRGGMVGIAPVPPDRLPEPLPPGLSLPLVITIQTDGPSNFDQPVPVRFPNLPDPVTGIKLGPGGKTVLWSFNHDTGRWEPQGSMTISADGNFAVTDPGVGVRQPGWHGAGAGGPGGGPSGPGPGPRKDCEDKNANGFCDEDDEKRCETDKLKTIFSGVDTVIGFVPQPDMGPLGSCVTAAGQSSSQGIRDCAIDPSGCKETVALKILDFSIDCGLSFVPTSAEFKEAVKWIKRVKGLFDVGLAYANWQLCKNAGPGPGPANAIRPAAVVGGFQTRGNPFLQQYEMENRLHRFIELTYGNARWAEIDPTEWALPAAIMAQIKVATQPGSDGGKSITPAERGVILALRRPLLIETEDVEALIDRMEKLVGNQTPAEGELDLPQLQQAADGLLAILAEVKEDGWERVFDGWTRGAAILASLSQTGDVAGAAAPASAGANAAPIQPAATAVSAMPARALYYRMIDLRSGFERHGRLNSQGLFDGIILPPSTPHVVIYFDAETGRSGVAYFTSQPGGLTIIPGAQMARPPGIPDTDGDGLSDVAEAALGTSSSEVDSDGDGVSDGAEIANGTNPVDNEPLSSGVVATRDTPGSAMEIDTVNDLAVVADSGSGLAVFDVSKPLAPVLVGEFDLDRTLAAVATAGDYVVAGPGTSSIATARVYVFKLQADGTLSAAGNLSVGAVVDTLVAAGRFAYMPGRSASNPTLAVVALAGPVLVRHVPIPGTQMVGALAIDGDILWALTSERLLSFRIAGDNLQPLGALAMGALSNPALAAGNGRVYAGDAQGFRVVDGSNPATPTLLYAPPVAQPAIRDLALNGSGLAVPVIAQGLAVYDVRNDRSTNFLTSFPLPGSSRAVAVHRGYALVTDDNSGLAVVNYLAADRGKIPPTITLRPFVSHPPGGQEAGAAFYVGTTTSDDVQVRDVEFHMDGVLVARSGKFPFAATLRAPPLLAGQTNFILRAKATDTGGNSAWSDAITVSLLPDSTPPLLVSVLPAAGSTQPRGSVSKVSAFFDSTLDIGRLRAGWTLRTAGPDGNLGTADDIPVTNGQVTFDDVDKGAFLAFATPLGSGKYRASLATSVADLGGNGLVTNVTWDFNIPAAKPVASNPLNQAVFLPGTLTRLELRFDEKLAPESVTPASLRLMTTNLANPAIIGGGTTSVAADRQTVVLQFAQPVGSGVYRFSATSDIRDVYGSPVDTNFPVVVTVKGPAEWSSDISGVWQFGTNWSGTFAPIVNDNVIIDRPGANPTVSLRSAVAVTTLRSEEPFVIDAVNGNLTVLDRAIFNGPLTIGQGGSRLSARLFEAHGPSVLSGSLIFYQEAVFTGPVLVNEGDFSMGGGRSRFFNTFESSRTTALGGHTMTLESGSVAKLGDNQVQFGGNQSRLVIAAGGRLETAPTNTTRISGTFVRLQVSSGGQIENAGEFIKKAAGTTYSALPLINSGTLSVEEGTLQLPSDSTNSGVIKVAAGASLELSSRFQHAGGSISGEGRIRIASGSVLNASYNFTGLTELYGQGSPLFNVPIHSTGSWLITGGAIFNGASTELLGPVTIDSATVTFNSPGETKIPNLQIVKTARLGGTGRLVFQGGQAITGQLTLIDSLALRYEGPLNIATNVTVEDQALMELAANSRWTAGYFRGNIRTLPGVTFELASTNSFSASVTMPFPQEGNLRKTGPGAVFLGSTSGSSVSNRTLIEVAGGSMSFLGGILVQTAGELRLATNTFFTVDALQLKGGLLSGSGTVVIRSSAVNRGCHLASTVSPGLPYGTLKFISEGFPIWEAGSRAIIDIAGPNAGVDYDQITSERTMQFSGGTLEIRTAAGFTPAVGQEFTIFTFTGRTGTFPEVLGADLGNGRHYRVIYETQAVKLRVE